MGSGRSKTSPRSVVTVDPAAAARPASTARTPRRLLGWVPFLSIGAQSSIHAFAGPGSVKAKTAFAVSVAFIHGLKVLAELLTSGAAEV